MKFLLLLASLATQALCLPSVKSRGEGNGHGNGHGHDPKGPQKIDFKDIKYYFAFGDSYTSTSFKVNGEQPNPGNPLGNPAYPGGTQVGSANYVDYLTYKYNESFIETYNFGFGGATIDYLIDPSPFGYLVQSYRQQVESEFIPTYGSAQNPPWTSSDSLFTVFFGINDVILVNSKANASDYTTALIKSYGQLSQELYNTGARNFVFLNVPAIDRTPGANPSNAASRAQEKAYLSQFNAAIAAFTQQFRASNKDATVFLFDTNKLWNDVLDNPSSYCITDVIRNTTDQCTPYNNSPDTTLFDPTCGIPRNEYFWADGLHPTSTVHDLIAELIAAEITIPGNAEGVGRGKGCSHDDMGPVFSSDHH